MASCFQTKSKKTSRRPSAYKAAKSRDLLACVNGGEHLVRFLKGPSSGYFSCLKKGRKAAYNNLDDLILHIFFISPPKIHDPLGLMSSEFCVCPSQKASFCFFLVGRLKASWLNDNASIEHRVVFFLRVALVAGTVELTATGWDTRERRPMESGNLSVDWISLRFGGCWMGYPPWSLTASLHLKNGWSVPIFRCFASLYHFWQLMWPEVIGKVDQSKPCCY